MNKVAKDKNAETGGDGDDSGQQELRSAEEDMMSLVKSFDAEQLKSFVKAQAHLPPSIHEGFTRFRLILGTRQKQFIDLPDIKLQLSYFHELFEKQGIFPSSWFAYSIAVGYLHENVGRFVEGSQEVFPTSAVLGRVLSMRAKYTLLGLKDLASMRALATGAEMKVLARNLMSFATQVEIVGDEDSEGEFLSALAAFDAEAQQQRRIRGTLHTSVEVPV